MNISDAKKIAEVITYEQLSEMFNRAKKGINNWKEVSAVNKGMSKGTAWNILYKCFTPQIINDKMALKNMIWEFGDYLDNDLKVNKKGRINPSINVCHQEPIF